MMADAFQFDGLSWWIDGPVRALIVIATYEAVWTIWRRIKSARSCSDKQSHTITCASFEPRVDYFSEGDCIEFLVDNEPYRGVRINGRLTLYVRERDKAVIGGLIECTTNIIADGERERSVREAYIADSKRHGVVDVYPNPILPPIANGPDQRTHKQRSTTNDGRGWNGGQG